MPKGGGPRGVRYQDAYRFSFESEGRRIEGTVFKALPRRQAWEARVDGSDIGAHGETRAEAVDAALQLAGAY